MRTRSPEDASQLPPFSIFLIGIIVGSIKIRTAFHMGNVFLELQYIGLRKLFLANDPNGLEFRPSRRPRCRHFDNVFHVECPLNKNDNEVLQFGTDHAP